MPILVQDFSGNFTNQDYIEPKTHCIVGACTRQPCSEQYIAGFDVINEEREQWVYMLFTGDYVYGDTPSKFHPFQYNISITQEWNDIIYSQREIYGSKFFEINSNIERNLESSVSYEFFNQFTVSGKTEKKQQIILFFTIIITHALIVLVLILTDVCFIGISRYSTILQIEN